MIKVNDRNFEWQEGLTVTKLLELKKFSYPKIIVVINDNIISKDKYEDTVINDGDNVKVIHLLAGG